MRNFLTRQKDMSVKQTKGTAVIDRRYRGGESGLLLMELMMYLALFVIISAVAFRVFYSCWDTSKAFRRNADEIAGTLKAGERWRAEVRGASAPLSVEPSVDGTVLHIPEKAGEIDYRFSEDAVWRRTGTNGDWAQFLPRIKSSRMEADRRNHVTAWRWEVELDARRKGARVVPLFTFEAVPQPTQTP
jgi:hypothetical protein